MNSIKTNKNAGVGAMAVILGIAGIAVVGALIFGVPEGVKKVFLGLKGKSVGVASVSFFGDFQKEEDAFTVDDAASTIVADLMSVQKMAKEGSGKALYGVCFKNASSHADFYNIVSNISLNGNPCDVTGESVINSVVMLPAEISFIDPAPARYKYVSFTKSGATGFAEDVLIMISSSLGSRAVTVTPAGFITYSNLSNASQVSSYSQVAYSKQVESVTRVSSAPTNINEIRRLSNIANGLASVAAGLEALKVSQKPTPVYTAPQDVPYPPQNLIVRTRANGFTATWSPPRFPGTAPIIDFRIYRTPYAGGGAEFVGIAQSGTFSFSGLAKHGATYYYRVTARNRHGESYTSNEVMATAGANN